MKLQDMALRAPIDEHAWTVHFEHALEAVLRVIQHPDIGLRQSGMACIKALLRSQVVRFKAFTEHVLLRLLAAGRDIGHDVASAAEESLELLISVSDAHRSMAVRISSHLLLFHCITNKLYRHCSAQVQVLVPVVIKEASPTLQLAIRLQSKLVPRFSQLQLLAILPQVLPPLFEAFKNPSADVRKAVVFCLVDMYMVLGEQLTPHLAVLSTSQLKLVTIYINRTASAVKR
jgi:CLIP-associating protein 1/2